MAGKVTDDHLASTPSRRRSTRSARTRKGEPADASAPFPAVDADRPDLPADGPVAAEDAVAEEESGIGRLYTTAMMVDVLGVPAAAVRHWVRERLLAPARRVGSLDWFDFGQLVVGRHLARLLAGGLSLREIDAKLAGLAAGGGPAAVRMVERIVADGRRLSIRRRGRLLGAGGQLQFAFYTSSFDGDDAEDVAAPDPPTVDIARGRSPSIVLRDAQGTVCDADTVVDDEVAEILDLADDLEAAGEFVEAAEALRAVLQAQGPTAAVIFMLAELLYRAGDLTAARERYYAAIELDADHMRARASLGCVLAELGDHELALAALEGVLRQEPTYADAHWHIAGVLFEMGRAREARHHLATFLSLSPESPWASLARERLAADA